MSGCDFRSAQLYDANFTSVTLNGASIDGAHLERANFDLEDFAGASAIDVSGLALNESTNDVWTASNEAVPLDDPTRKALADKLEELACNPRNAQHVAHGIIRNRFLTHAGKFLIPVADKFKSPRTSNCLGAIGLTGDDLIVLEDQRKAALEF